MRLVEPEGWARPSGYANGVAARGEVLAIAGQVGWNPATCRVESADLVVQARTALENVAAVVRAAGGVPENVVRMTWYVVDRDAYSGALRALGAAYREVFGRHYPAMTLIVVAGLLEPGALVEIEATAVLPDRS